MKTIKCITFDKAAQDTLPEHIKAKMKRDRKIAEFCRKACDLSPSYCEKAKSDLCTDLLKFKQNL